VSSSIFLGDFLRMVTRIVVVVFLGVMDDAILEEASITNSLQSVSVLNRSGCESAYACRASGKSLNAICLGARGVDFINVQLHFDVAYFVISDSFATSSIASRASAIRAFISDINFVMGFCNTLISSACALASAKSLNESSSIFICSFVCSIRACFSFAEGSSSDLARFFREVEYDEDDKDEDDDEDDDDEYEDEDDDDDEYEDEDDDKDEDEDVDEEGEEEDMDDANSEDANTNGDNDVKGEDATDDDDEDENNLFT
jgi:hypothetical protein